jgi:hypothetical protein
LQSDDDAWRNQTNDIIYPSWLIANSYNTIHELDGVYYSSHDRNDNKKNN